MRLDDIILKLFQRSVTEKHVVGGLAPLFITNYDGKVVFGVPWRAPRAPTGGKYLGQEFVRNKVCRGVCCYIVNNKPN